MTQDPIPGVVTTVFCGTSTLWVTDGSTGILIDGFFSRPSLARIIAGQLRPNQHRITHGMDRAGIDRVDAVVVAHSHFDHAMDAPEIARRTGAVLLGSDSTLNIARGADLAEDVLQRIEHGDTLRFGDFTVTVFEGLHSPGDRYPGTIDTPLRTPARASAYRTGACYSFHLSHPEGTMLIHPSARDVPHAYDDVTAEVLFLGVGALGAQDEDFQHSYWRHVVGATDPRLIVPLHWDDFTRGLHRPLRSMPFYLDKAAATRAAVARHADAAGIPVHWPDRFERLQPFRP